MRRHGERGAALVTVLILVVALTVIGTAMVTVMLTEITIAYNQSDAVGARAAAEAGVARAIYELGVNPAWAGVTAAIGAGQYQVIVTSSGTVRFVDSLGTRGGGRQRLHAAVKVVPRFLVYGLLANTTATLGSAIPGVTIRNALPSADAGAVHANNRLGAGTALTINPTGATVIGGVTANGTISGISCATWPWRCNAAFGVLPFPRLDADSASATSLRSRARTTVDPADGLNLYFHGGDASSRCNSGGTWNFDASHTQQCWDRYVDARARVIGQTIPSAVFFVEFNGGERTRYTLAGGGSTITFRGAASAGGVGTLTIAKPAGVLDNDVMIAAIAFDGGSTNAITAPPGWTLVRRINNGVGIGLAVYRKVAANEGASYTWTDNLAQEMSGGIQVYTGVDTTTPIDVEAGQPTPDATVLSTPSITTTGANEMLVTSFAILQPTTFTPPAGETQRYQVLSTGGGDTTTSEGNDQLQAAAGATGVKTATTADNGLGAAHILALRPQAGRTVDCVGYTAAVETLCLRARPATDSTNVVVYANSDLRQVTGAIVVFRRVGTSTTVVGDLAFENMALSPANYTHTSLSGDPALLAAGNLLMVTSGASAGRTSTTVRGIIYTFAGLDNPDGNGNLQGSSPTVTCPAPCGVQVQYGADGIGLVLRGIVMSNGTIVVQDTVANTGTVTVQADSAVTDTVPGVFTGTDNIVLPISWSSGN
jgi:hypothetical protein